MNRPELKDCRETAIERLVPKVVAWCGDGESEENVKRALAEAIHGCYQNGFEIAKNLDSRGWYGCDPQLVEILDSFSWYVRDAHKEAVRKWVSWEKVAPQFNEGAEAAVTSQGKEYSGFIARIDGEVAEYLVRVPELGHVAEGLGTHGLVVPFEAVQAMTKFVAADAAQEGEANGG